jgi:hypothetical protein
MEQFQLVLPINGLCSSFACKRVNGETFDKRRDVSNKVYRHARESQPPEKIYHERFINFL